MDDIDDGIKTSIQDGVMEDPDIPTFTEGYFMKLSMNALDKDPDEIELILETTTDAEQFVGTIGLILGTSVT